MNERAEEQEYIDFQNRQFWEKENPPLDPPQLKPQMTGDGKSVMWAPPASGLDGKYFLVQVRVCEKDGLKGALGMCGQWWDMYKTADVSCDIAQFELDPAESHEVRVRTCRNDDLLEESVDDCKKAWFRSWSSISNKFKPAAPTPTRPSPNQLAQKHTADRTRGTQNARAIRQNLFASGGAEREQMARDMARRQNEDARKEWKTQRDAEWADEEARTQLAGVHNAGKIGVGKSWHEDPVLDALLKIQHMAEEQGKTREGNKVLVQTYIEGGRKIAGNAAKSKASELSWMGPFRTTLNLNSKYKLTEHHDTAACIRMTRLAFNRAIEMERAEYGAFMRAKQAQESKLKSGQNQAQLQDRQATQHAKHTEDRKQEEYRAKIMAQAKPTPYRQTQPVSSPQTGGCASLLRTEENQLSVQLAVGWQTQLDADAGPMSPRSTAKVVEDVGGSKPCKVEVTHGSATGKVWAYTLAALKMVKRSGHHK